MLAFVTGTTGFLGSHVARVLAEQGADLRLLVRASSNTKNIDELKAALVTGDLRDPASLAQAPSGVYVIFPAPSTPASTALPAPDARARTSLLLKKDGAANATFWAAKTSRSSRFSTSWRRSQAFLRPTFGCRTRLRWRRVLSTKSSPDEF